ncbi:MAG: AAA family ATPase, partial [Sulfitobacter geojensis]
MRILCIRGENIASLAKPFEISLDAAPLSSAGLFAITGETGAGKSSILDAMCLA